MGSINSDINQEFISPVKDIIKPFLFGFDVNYGALRKAANTFLYVYILQPLDFMREAYGLDKEILLAYAKYPKMEPRTLQAINIILKEYPFGNRVDNLNYFLVSDDSDVENWMQQFSIDLESSQIPIVFTSEELCNNSSDSWFIRNKLIKNFFGTDLFDYTLPIKDDYRFFGRQRILARYIDAVKKGENRGIFGLRKTGKTSFLFKLERTIREQHLGYTFFYDCKSPSYRKMHWNEFLGALCSNIAKRLGIHIKTEYDEIGIIKSFRYVMKEASLRNKRIIVFFDEIEFISFRAPMDKHWHTEFIDFWQTMWSVQSLHRNLVFIISGVNPSVIEIDTINGIQNPLFGIVQSEYLKGLEADEVRVMIKALGKRMGMQFSHDAIDLLIKQYNGHPLLTRLACSQINKINNLNRPLNLTRELVYSYLNDINSELKYYFQHVVSEIMQFYPEEYEMFEMLASGQISDFIEFAQINDFVSHLYAYGLVENNEKGRPYIKLPVAGDFVAMMLAKKEKRNTKYKLIPKEKRAVWVRSRCSSIIRDIRHLELIVSKNSLPKIFGENSFPEADKFASLTPVETPKDFDYFINVCNRCFVESIENYGKSINLDKYFWNEIKNNYPDLFDALHRIKVYRNYTDHLTINKTVASNLINFIEEDGENIQDVNEKSFCIQQKLLELLFSSIQIELNSID